MAASLNIVAEQYSSYTLNLTIQNADSSAMDLTNHSGTFKIARLDNDAKVLEFSGIADTNKVTITSAAAGKLEVFINEVTLAPIISTDITKEKPDYYYTLVLTNGAGVKTRVLDGLMSISKGII
jgi:hypothetical protein